MASRPQRVTFVDIRSDKKQLSLLQAVFDGLQPQDGRARSLPTLLLYDEQGLRLFEDITYLDEYYLTNAEIEVLQADADRIVDQIANGSRLVELGSGNLRKVDILLKAFEKAQKTVEYYALDLSLPELERTFSHLDLTQYHYVSFHALHGTYDDGLAWLTRSDMRNTATCVMSLGSSLGNFSRQEAAEFLASFANVLGPQDCLLVGLDACQDAAKVHRAYNDPYGVTEQFYRNGLDHVNRLLGRELFHQDDWTIEGVFNPDTTRHAASYVALRDVHDKDFHFAQGEKLHFENAYKYSTRQSDGLWRAAGLVLRCSYGKSDYHVHLLSPSTSITLTDPMAYAATPVPSPNDWHELWTAWDTATRSMVPQDQLLNKPIKLRNNLIFYLGHIPAFADIHLSKATGEKATEPAHYHAMFERGIDPDVDDPSQCHAHSEIPETWPPLDEMLDYQVRVRARTLACLSSQQKTGDRKLGRALALMHDHEAMHLETFLYMLLQSDRVLPPPGRPTPDFQATALAACKARTVNEWHDVPAATVTIGLNDPENDDGPDRYFAWDIERPARKVKVDAFQAQSRPISNGEYASFLEQTKRASLPASWTTRHDSGYTSGEDGELHPPASEQEPSRSFAHNKFVRTVYGPVPLRYAFDWPVMASYDELAVFAKWFDGRIPTHAEARRIYDHVEANKGAAEQIPSSLISAVNGHLSNEGVEETPPHDRAQADPAQREVPDITPTNASAQLDPASLFIDLAHHNVAFSSCHPTPVTSSNELRGQADLGGLWEWTSTVLTPHDGYKPMALYPGYSADFFDGKHNVCLGGSWATLPRIAGKKSFVNWYQRNYPYVWCTARLVRDAKK